MIRELGWMSTLVKDHTCQAGTNYTDAYEASCACGWFVRATSLPEAIAEGRAHASRATMKVAQ